MTARIILIAAAASVLGTAGIASAQTAAPPTATLAATAKAQIEASGYTEVKDLQRKEDGSWQARAMKNNTEVAVSVDPRGSVTQLSR